MTIKAGALFSESKRRSDNENAEHRAKTEQKLRQTASKSTPVLSGRWLLFRRNLKKPDSLAYYFAYAREGVTLAELAGAAGLHWTIEECFLRAKDDLGLDHCEAHSWHGWHRHMTLVMAAATATAATLTGRRAIKALSHGRGLTPRRKLVSTIARAPWIRSVRRWRCAGTIATGFRWSGNRASSGSSPDSLPLRIDVTKPSASSWLLRGLKQITRR